MTTLFTDDFNRADSGTLGSNYTDIDAGFGIASNTAKASTAGLNSTIINAVSFPADQWVQVTLAGTMSGNADEGIGVVLRGAAGGDLYFVHCSTVDSHLYKRVGGTYTDISGAQAAFALSDVLYAEVQGTTLLYKKNGTTVWSGTDSALSSGAAGLWGDASTGLIAADSLTAGDFASPGTTVTPGAGTLTLAGQAPTVARTTNATITPAAAALALLGQEPQLLKHIVTAGDVDSHSYVGGDGLVGGLEPPQNTQPQTGDGALLLAGQAPTVTATTGSNVTATPAAGALVLAGLAPTVLASLSASPSAGALVLAGQAPSLLQNLIAQPAAGSLVLAGQAPAVLQDSVRAPAAGALVLAGQAPVLLQDSIRAPGAGALVLAGQAPS